MTTPIDSTSPFAGSTPTSKDFEKVSSGADEFSIRTMQDDLLDLEKKSEPIKPVAPAEVSRKIIPTQIPVAAPAPAQRLALTPVTQSIPISNPAPRPMPAPTPTSPRPVSAPTPTPRPVSYSAPAPRPVQIPKNTAVEPKNVPEKTSYPFMQQTNTLNKKGLVEVSLPEKKTDPVNTRKFALIAIVALLVIVIIWGGYYFIFRSSSKQVAVIEPEVTQPVEIQQEEESAPVIEVATEKYSSEKPNYLPLDITTISSEDIQKTITSVAEELKAMPIDNQLHYEFVIVDANNNPIAFPIFATAAKFNLSPAVLKNLGENFSFFLYNDNGNERLSVVVTIKDKGLLVTALQNQEKTFINDASFLFLNEKPEKTTGSLQNSTYKSATIRFFNLNNQLTLSIDYTTVNTDLIIATSKDTMRAIIDFLPKQ